MQGNTAFNVNAGGGPVDLSVTGNLVNCYGVGSVVKNGNGVMVLSGTGNTYTGTTTVNAGTLAVNGSSSPAATSSVDGGVLSGSGIMNGLFVNGSGQLAPGSIAGAGTLTANAARLTAAAP